MVEIELDGKKVEVQEGSMVMHAAEKAGTFIPHFCYHKKLSIAANCRMCLVDVEKAPKPMPACATPVTQGMIVRTHTDKAVKAQKSVMEFLLINHPLDCPICDQAGECKLQQYAYLFGKPASSMEEEKTKLDKRKVLTDKMQNELYETGGLLVLFFGNQLDGYNPRVQGLVERPNTLNLDHFGRGMKRIWLDK
mgnify:CR=1 FL=1